MLFVEFLLVQESLFRMFWAYGAMFIDENDFLNFFCLIFIVIHKCIASGAKLSFVSVCQIFTGCKLLKLNFFVLKRGPN